MEETLKGCMWNILRKNQVCEINDSEVHGRDKKKIITLWLAVAIRDMGLSLTMILNAMCILLINPEGSPSK